MQAGSTVPSLIFALIVASLATTPVHATVSFNFEPPAYSTTTSAGILDSQDGWVAPPAQPGVQSSHPFVVTGFFPDTQGQFALVQDRDTPGASRCAADHLNIVHDLTKPLWTYQFDFAMDPDNSNTVSPVGVGPQFSVVPRDPDPGATPTARTFTLSWSRQGTTRIATNISAYGPDGTPFTAQFPDTAPGQNSGWLSAGTWYTYKMVVNTTTNECISLEWAPRGTTPLTSWSAFYLGGGATSTLPAPNGIRLGSLSDDTAGFDNILIDTQFPEPKTLTLLTATSLIGLSRRTTRAPQSRRGGNDQ